MHVPYAWPGKVHGQLALSCFTLVAVTPTPLTTVTFGLILSYVFSDLWVVYGKQQQQTKRFSRWNVDMSDWRKLCLIIFLVSNPRVAACMQTLQKSSKTAFLINLLTCIIYLHQKFSKASGFGHTQPRLVTLQPERVFCEAWWLRNTELQAVYRKYCKSSWKKYNNKCLPQKKFWITEAKISGYRWNKQKSGRISRMTNFLQCNFSYLW